MTKVAEHSQTWPDWLSMEDACAYSGRSLATLKNWVTAGKISKRMVSMPGARDRAQLSRVDLDRAVGSPMHIPVVAEVSQTGDRLALASQSEPRRFEANGLEHALSRLAEAFPPRPAVQIVEKLTWSLREAREMTGLTEPALRELVARKPALAIRQGRRWWIKAEALRRELS